MRSTRRIGRDFGAIRTRDWSQIEAPVPRGEMLLHGLSVDWHRFVTQRTVDFFNWEKAAVRAGGSELPVTTNLMSFYYDLDYTKFADSLDLVSWDSYPSWRTDPARRRRRRDSHGDGARLYAQLKAPAVFAHGEYAEPGQLEADQPPESAGPEPARRDAGRRARVEFGAVFPVAPEPRRQREIPRRRCRPLRRAGYARVP